MIHSIITVLGFNGYTLVSLLWKIVLTPPWSNDLLLKDHRFPGATAVSKGGEWLLIFTVINV